MVHNLSTSNSEIVRSQRSRVRNAVIGILTFFIFVTMIDVIVGGCLERLYFSQQSGANAELTKAVVGQECELAILGSSRAVHHYDPEVLESILGMKTYNFGRDGQGLFYHDGVQAALLAGRSHPRLVLIDLLPGDLDSSRRHYERLAVFHPYVSRVDYLKTLVEKRSRTERWKLWSRLYRFNSQLLPSVFHSFFSGHSMDRNQGYKPLPTGRKIKAHQTRPASDSTDANLTKSLDKIISRARDHEVEVIAVISPRFGRVEKSPHFAELLDRCKKSHVRLWNYLEDPRFVDRPELFYDAGHLNAEGARIFSEIIAEQVAAEIDLTSS